MRRVPPLSRRMPVVCAALFQPVVRKQLPVPWHLAERSNWRSQYSAGRERYTQVASPAVKRQIAKQPPAGGFGCRAADQ